jgi:hypothetical protein
MLVDTFTVNVKIPPGGKTYSNNDARIAYCKNNNWKKKECQYM